MLALFEHESVYMLYNINRWPQIYSCKVLRFALVIRWIEPRTVCYLRICSWQIPNASLLPLKWPQFQDALLQAPSQRALCILIPFIFNQDRNILPNHFHAAYGIVSFFSQTYTGWSSTKFWSLNWWYSTSDIKCFGFFFPFMYFFSRFGI